MTSRRFLTAVVAAAAAVAPAGCAQGADAETTHDEAAPAAAPATATRDRAATATAGTIRLTVAPQGNTARYRVREQLMGRDLPNDAVGETQQVSGAITVNGDGTLVPSQSRIVVRTDAFKSDSDRRDGYVRRRLLQAEQFPTVELVPTALRGLPTQLPGAGEAVGPVTFQLTGDLTVRGVTRPTTWQVSARQTGGRVTGTASTQFTFADFSIEPPRVPILLSVADTIRLEYDFTLTRADSAGR